MSLQKIPKETIMAAIDKIGPSQPIDIRKELKEGDSFLIGAMLSELVADGKLQITKVRRGGSPFYFNPAKPETLDVASKWLNEKDRRTYSMLKEQKVMREDAQDPLVRVGLKNMPDFSKQLVVDGVTHWKHYLLSDDDALKLVKGDAKTEQPPAPTKENPAQRTMPEVVPEAIVAEVKPAAPVQQELPSEKPVKEKKARAPRKKVEKKDAPVQTTIAPNPHDWAVHDTLYEKVKNSLQGEVHHPNSIKPHAELTCVLTKESEFGTISYYVYALNKKKFTEKEVTKALLEARGKGMPLIVLSVEEIPAKLAKSFDDIANIFFKKI